MRDGATLDLLSWSPPPSDRLGATYAREFDFERLNAQQARVFHAMKDGRWRTLSEIAAITDDPEASISARLRDLRRPEFGGLKVNRRRRGEETRGLFEYSLGGF